MNEQVRNRLTEHGVTYRDGGWYELPSGEKVRGWESALNRVNGRSAEQHETSSVGRMRFIRKAGFQYDSDRNVYEVAGYVPQGTLDYDHYFSYWDRHPIAGRIVDLPAKTTWKNPPELVTERDNDPFVNEFNSLVKRLKLWHYFERADRLARIGRFGVLLIGTVGEGGYRGLREPLGDLDGPGDVLYLTPFAEGEVDIDEWVDDPFDRRHGKPERYKIDMSSDVEGFTAGSVNVHWSRVIHIAEDLTTDEVFGRPPLKRCMNLIFDDEKVTASTAEAFWQLADRILVASIDPGQDLEDSDRDKLGKALQEMQHDLRKQLVASGIDLSWVGEAPPDPSAVADTIATRLAAGGDIPKRVLFGTETGERASEQDEREWLGSVSSRQERHAEPTILRSFTDRLVEHGGLSAPADGSYGVAWPSLFEAPEKDQVEIDQIRAEIAAMISGVGASPLADGVVEIDERGRVVLLPTGEGSGPA